MGYTLKQAQNLSLRWVVGSGEVCSIGKMAEELEVLWQKLRVTEVEEKSVTLGRDCTKAAKERGKNCLVMKVLSRRELCLML